MSLEIDSLVLQATDILAACRAAGLKLVTAESCTGGLIAAVLTEVPGSSDVFERGFVTYSNASKTEAIGVAAETIDEHGAVSESVARSMASGALAHSSAGLAIAVTGVAGPNGGTVEKPVGTVHLAAARRGGGVLHRLLRTGDIGRGAIRRETVAAAFALLASVLEEPGRS